MADGGKGGFHGLISKHIAGVGLDPGATGNALAKSAGCVQGGGVGRRVRVALGRDVETSLAPEDLGRLAIAAYLVSADAVSTESWE